MIGPFPRPSVAVVAGRSGDREGEMSVVVVVLDGLGGQPLPFGPGLAHALAGLGVTEATLATGPDGTVLVLSGWAFDGRRHQQAVVDLVGRGSTLGVLHGVADVTLRPDTATFPKPSPTRRSS